MSVRALGDLVRPTVVDAISLLGSPRLHPVTVLCPAPDTQPTPHCLDIYSELWFPLCLVHSQVSTPQAVTATLTSLCHLTAHLSVTIAWFFSLNPTFNIQSISTSCCFYPPPHTHILSGSILSPCWSHPNSSPL